MLHLGHVLWLFGVVNVDVELCFGLDYRMQTLMLASTLIYSQQCRFSLKMVIYQDQGTWFFGCNFYLLLFLYVFIMCPLCSVTMSAQALLTSCFSGDLLD